ncbi:unnamed protein product, partial [Musa acuminata var. zebrina]
MEASSPVGSRSRTKKSLNPVDSNQHPRNFFPSLRRMGFLYNTPRVERKYLEVQHKLV